MAKTSVLMMQKFVHLGGAETRGSMLLLAVSTSRKSLSVTRELQLCSATLPEYTAFPPKMPCRPSDIAFTPGKNQMD